MKKYLIELIGTFFLVLTVAFSANPIAIGVVLAVMIYMGGYISGAHYNPAVTFAVYLQKKISSKDAVRYVVAQFLGAIAACFIFHLIKEQIFIVQPGHAYGFQEALLAEILFTFALCLVVLNTAVSKENTPNQFYGLAIGGTVMAGAFSVGSISGGAFNPAVGVAPLLAQISTISQNMSLLILYIAGPILGAMLASLVFTFTNTAKE